MDTAMAMREVDEYKKEKWLELYCAGGITAVDTCDEVGIPITQVSRWRKTDLTFSETYDRVEAYNKEVWPDDRPLKFGETGEVLAKIEEKEFAEMRRNQTKIENRELAETKKIEKKITKEAERKENLRRMKETWLKTFEKLYFNISETCRACGISQGSISRWRIHDKEFQDAFSEAVETKKDFIEGQLMENIRNGDTASIIFACKTKLKDRGYVEKQQIEHSGNFGVMLAPGTAKSEDEWEVSAKAQQIALVEKTNNTSIGEEHVAIEPGKTSYLEAPGRKPNSISKLSDIRGVVRRDKG